MEPYNFLMPSVSEPLPPFLAERFLEPRLFRLPNDMVPLTLGCKFGSPSKRGQAPDKPRNLNLSAEDLRSTPRAARVTRRDSGDFLGFSYTPRLPLLQCGGSTQLIPCLEGQGHLMAGSDYKPPPPPPPPPQVRL